MTADESILTAPAVNSVAEFDARLAAIVQVLPATDGLTYFTQMYRLVTSSIQQDLGATTFADPDWINHLDVVFGNLYLDMLRASVLDLANVPRAWAPVVERRADPRIAPLQFALAGMSAHINRDLVVAVNTTCTDLHTPPEDGPHHADYFRVNDVLAQVEPAICQAVEGSALEEANRLFPGLQDVVANFNMVKARETAWANAGTLWALGGVAPNHGEAYLVALDHLSGFAGRGLLVRLKPIDQLAPQ